MSRSRATLFIENFLVYGAINALEKVIPLLMLPIITHILTDTSEFGRFDMFITIMSLGSSFAVLGMYDAMFREYFEKEEELYRQKVTSTASKIVFISSCLVTLILILFNNGFSQLFLGNSQSGFIVIMAGIGVFLSANKEIISAPTRIQNKRRVYVMSGLLNSATYYLLAITLIFFGFGYKGMIYANLIAICVILLFFAKLNLSYFRYQTFDPAVAKELFKLGLPLVLTLTIFWVFRSMDKIMIANMLDLSQVGIYSIGSRMASISQFIYAAFAGGWQFFAFSTMKEDGQVEVNSKLFEYLAAISFTIFFVAIIIDDYVFQLLFVGDYTKGVSVFPFLFLSPLLLMLFQTVATQFTILKKSYINTIMLSIGLIINLILNLIFIDKFGIKGASMATLIGYFIPLIITMFYAHRKKIFKIKMRLAVSFFITMYVCMLSFFEHTFTNSISLLSIFIFIFLYRNEALHFKKILRSRH